MESGRALGARPGREYDTGPKNRHRDSLEACLEEERERKVERVGDGDSPFVPLVTTRHCSLDREKNPPNQPISKQRLLGLLTC